MEKSLDFERRDFWQRVNVNVIFFGFCSPKSRGDFTAKKIGSQQLTKEKSTIFFWRFGNCLRSPKLGVSMMLRVVVSE